MDEVTRIAFRPEDFDRFSYTRLNRAYEPVHRLARLLLEEMSLSEQLGDYEFVSFLLDMNELFERFVRAAFEAFTPSTSGKVLPQQTRAMGYRHWSDGSMRRWGTIRPDIELTRRGHVAGVFDTKYKPTPAGQIHNPDVYQVLAYCVAESTNLGSLIYPRMYFSEDDEIRIRNSDIRIRRFAIDLEVRPELLLAEAEDLVTRALAWLGPTAVSAMPA
jgi:5-methylcytosine-specific restriction enzyme subunit McrC